MKLSPALKHASKTATPQQTMAVSSNQVFGTRHRPKCCYTSEQKHSTDSIATRYCPPNENQASNLNTRLAGKRNLHEFAAYRTVRAQTVGLPSMRMSNAHTNRAATEIEGSEKKREQLLGLNPPRMRKHASRFVTRHHFGFSLFHFAESREALTQRQQWILRSAAKTGRWSCSPTARLKLQKRRGKRS